MTESRHAEGPDAHIARLQPWHDALPDVHGQDTETLMDALLPRPAPRNAQEWLATPADTRAPPAAGGISTLHDADGYPQAAVRALQSALQDEQS